MIIYLYGPDSYRRNKKVKEAVGRYKEKRDSVDIASFDLSEEDEWKRAKDFLAQPSMFVDSKLAIVHGGGRLDKKEWVETLKKYIGKNSKVFILISDVKPPLAKLKFLKEKSEQSQEFEELEGNKLKKFMEKRLDFYGVKLSPQAERFLTSFVLAHEFRAGLLENEVIKISRAGFKNPVGIDELKELISWSGGEKMFSAVKKIMNARNREEKLMRLESIISRGEPVDYLFNSLAFQARGRDLFKLAEYDVLKKSGKLDYEEAVLDFVLEQ